MSVNQHQRQNFQYKCQDSSTVWGGNLENYESHHPEDTTDECRVARNPGPGFPVDYHQPPSKSRYKCLLTAVYAKYFGFVGQTL
ncbi:unnamed protein product [Schistosoma curassoni]|uniref:Uncharacterized protein n=1 Tax=Schistosoma curassoni TaxID=6186 RepID=A0A183KZK9_9TREM|nr:unnamed protein product [Schistosoma curassoni]